MTVIYKKDNVKLDGFEGDTFRKIITLRDGAGALVDITGATIRMKLGSLNETSSGVTITNGGAAGTITIEVTYTAMAAFIAEYTYDIAVEVTMAGIRKTLFTGHFIVLEDVR